MSAELSPNATAPAAAVPQVAMRGISKAFGPVKVLEAVDFSLAPGEIHALMGENGAGKSTLVKVLCGVYQADAGAIAVEGQAVQIRTAKYPLGRAEGFLLGLAGSKKTFEHLDEIGAIERLLHLSLIHI